MVSAGDATALAAGRCSLPLRGAPAAPGGLLRTLRHGLCSDHLRCAGSSECAADSVSEAIPIAQGSLAMRVIRLLAAIVTAIAALSAPAYGASWTTQTTFGPTGPAESALTSVSCVSALSCMAVGVDDNGYNSSQTSLEDVGSFAESSNGSVWTVVPDRRLGSRRDEPLCGVVRVGGVLRRRGRDALVRRGGPRQSICPRSGAGAGGGVERPGLDGPAPIPARGYRPAGCSACRAPRAGSASRSENTAITGWPRSGTAAAGASRPRRPSPSTAPGRRGSRASRRIGVPPWGVQHRQAPPAGGGGAARRAVERSSLERAARARLRALFP